MGALHSKEEDDKEAISRELVLLERLTSGFVDCEHIVRQRLRRLASSVRCPKLQSKLMAMEQQAQKMALVSVSSALRELRKDIVGIAVCAFKQQLLRPEFNIREIRSRVASLEANLCFPQATFDTFKAVATIEALVDEGLSLDSKESQYRRALLEFLDLVLFFRKRVSRREASVARLSGYSHDISKLRRQCNRLLVASPPQNRQHCGGVSWMDAASDPSFCLLEVLKNVFLFQDHLSSPEKFCRECLNKHALLMEAFLGFFRESTPGSLRPPNVLGIEERVHALRPALRASASAELLVSLAGETEVLLRRILRGLMH